MCNAKCDDRGEMVDLYQDDLSRLTGAELFTAVGAFALLNDVPANRPKEAFVLDLKETWNDKAVQTVGPQHSQILSEDSDRRRRKRV